MANSCPQAQLWGGDLQSYITKIFKKLTQLVVMEMQPWVRPLSAITIHLKFIIVTGYSQLLNHYKPISFLPWQT